MKMNYDYEKYPIGAEKFTELNYQGKILPKYLVTDYGRVYNTETHKFSAIETTYNGYQRVRITPEFRKGTNYSLHRGVLLSFQPIENFKDMQVNHIDGDKTNNKLENLEWVSPMENIKHADENGLRHHHSKHSVDEIHEICQLLDQGLSTGQIADILRPELKGYEREKFTNIVGSIRRGQNWTSISQNYNFMANNIFRRYDENFAHQVCRILSEPNHNYTYNDLMVKLNLNVNEYINFRNFIHNLFTNSTATLVSKYYPNLSKPLDY